MTTASAELVDQYAKSILVATHEAGHALVGHHLGVGVEWVEVGLARDSGGTMMVGGFRFCDPWRRAQILAAGHLAETRSWAWSQEFEALRGSDDDFQGLEVALRESGATLEEVADSVNILLWLHSDRLRHLAWTLEDRTRLSGAEVAELLG